MEKYLLSKRQRKWKLFALLLLPVFLIATAYYFNYIDTRIFPISLSISAYVGAGCIWGVTFIVIGIINGFIEVTNDY